MQMVVIFVLIKIMLLLNLCWKKTKLSPSFIIFFFIKVMDFSFDVEENLEVSYIGGNHLVAGSARRVI